MADEDLLNRIRSLVDEEHELRSPGAARDPERLAHLEESLDQCWDLLRQRRAKREFHADPASASARDVETVEHYQQ
jgi:Protein of unknown function (DUF2630)